MLTAPRDSSTTWIDLEEKDSKKGYKMFRSASNPAEKSWCYWVHFSEDGIHWSEAQKTGACGDRMHFDPGALEDFDIQTTFQGLPVEALAGHMGALGDEQRISEVACRLQKEIERGSQLRLAALPARIENRLSFCGNPP